MISVVVCDDHHVIRAGVIKLLDEVGTCRVIGEAAQGDELFLLFHEGKIPDVVILDIHMPPGLSGYDVVRRMRKDFKSVKIIVFSNYADPRAVEGMLSIGASGFISKGVSLKLLEKAITEVSNDQLYVGLSRTDDLQATKTQTEEFGIETLTKRELEVARLMCTDKTYKEMAEQLHISPNTIDNIRERVFRKTGAKNRSAVIIMLVKTGLFN
jgi:DNA-binding NarL/FixJ family response regulator